MNAFKKGEFQLKIDKDGTICSLCYGGVEFATELPEKDIFLIQMRDFVGNPQQLERQDFAKTIMREYATHIVIRYDECARMPGTFIEIQVKKKDNRLYWSIQAHLAQDWFQIEWIDFPRIRLRNYFDGKFLLPFAEGTLVDDLALRERTASFRCEYIDYPMTGVGNFYPGPAAMQFEAYYTSRAGLCFICADSTHAPKCIDAQGLETGNRILLQHFTGGHSTLGYEVIIEGFSGDWQDATDCYRKWMEHYDKTLPEKGLNQAPEWLRNSPVLLVYPVKGNGLDLGGLDANEFYPYRNALPIVESYQNALQNPLMTLLMHWEGTAPWAPPYVWPPHGGEEELKDFVSSMHKKGNLVGLYASGIGWTQRSMIDPRYDCEEAFERDNVKHEICSGPRGETYSRVCQGQRIGYDLCPARDFTTHVVTHEIEQAAAAGVDYLQYFDQNQGGAAPLCYSSEHGHPPLPGAWETTAMRELFAKAAAAAGSDMIIGCENAAAEPYISSCRLNDLRNHLAWGAGGNPVAVYPYLFHEYTTGFSGNGVCLSVWVDIGKTPFFLQWSLAWNFASGNILSLVLKDGGKIHWHWALPWSETAPKQEPLIELVKNLSYWRRGPAAPWLIAGRMIKSPHISCGTRTIYLRKRSPEEVPAVLVSSWSADAGTVVILVNYGETAEPCRIDFATKRSGSVEGRDNQRRFDSSTEFVTVPPLDMLLIKFDEAYSLRSGTLQTEADQPQQ